MAERKYTHGLSVRIEAQTTIINIGDMEIWDGADLSLIRDTLISMVRSEGLTAIGVDVRFVKYIPSGFFGMLFDWFDQGIEIRLYHPTDRVAAMVWFRQFFALEADAVYALHDGTNCPPVLAGDGEEATWQTEPRLGESTRLDPARVL